MPVQRELRIQTVCLLCLALIAIAAAAYVLRPVLIPFVLAVFFTYALIPLVELQRRHLRFPSWAALVTTLMFGVGSMAVLVVVTTASIRRFAEQSSAYLTQLDELREQVIAWLPLERLGVHAADLQETLLQGSGQVAGSLFRASLDGVLGFLSNGALVLVFMLFLLIGKTTGPANLRSGGLLGEVERNIESYVVAKVAISIATGLLHGLILVVLGVPFAVVFGVLAFLLNFVPNLGPVAATLLPLPVVLLNPQLSPVVKVLAIALPAVLQTVSGNVVEPKIMGDSLDLHPITVLVTLIFFGMLWGIAGMFLATPITAVLKILFEKVEVMRPISRLMAGRLDDLTQEATPPPERGTQQRSIPLPANIKRAPPPDDPEGFA